jgi:hypothetical protein
MSRVIEIFYSFLYAIPVVIRDNAAFCDCQADFAGQQKYFGIFHLFAISRLTFYLPQSKWELQG